MQPSPAPGPGADASGPSAKLNRRNLWLVLAAAFLFTVMRLSPAPAGMAPDAWAVAALAAVMAFLWLSEALPLPMTATLPFLLLPLMGVLDPGDVAGLYWSPIIFLVFGGALFAVAIEAHGLHRRLALGIAAFAPASPRGLILAFMAATALVSMLVSNTATALIMMPVALAILVSLEGKGDGNAAAGPGFGIALVLGVAYAASIGGLGTLVGSPTNAIAAGIAERALGLRIDFLTWLMFGLPLVLVAIPLGAITLVTLFGVPAVKLDRAHVTAALGGAPGPLTSNQKRLLPLMALLLAGWILLPLLGGRLGLPDIDDATVAVGVGLLLFLVPASGGGALLNWQDAARVPWDILLLFGGGLALAGAITTSGLAPWIGDRMQGLEGLEPWLLALAVVVIVVLVTEFASNVAAASAFMPVVAVVAAETGADPLPLVMAAAFAASWGFMMPAGTGPNAIAFSTGRVSIPQMVKAGLLIDVIGVPLIVAVVFGVDALLR